MSEIYTSSSVRKAYLNVPVTPIEGTLTVKIFEAGIEVYEAATVIAETNGYSVDIPFFLVQTDRELKIVWEFDYIEAGTTYTYRREDPIEVVTPLLELTEISEIIGETGSDAEAVKIERATRFIIQAHTGQSFGKFVGKKIITGSGDSHLRLPMRLLKLNNVNGSGVFLPNLIIRGDGWYLKNIHFGIPPLKADFHGLHYLNNGVIEAPPHIPRLSWRENIEYEIDGEWGWNSVPEPVREAAKLLVNDYACADSNYRDRYLSSISAADWKIAFNAGAYAGTGNVRADQLLSNYVLKRGWAVV